MQAKETSFLKFLRERNQFRIPIFQRRYSWEKHHCEQLWRDVLRIGQDDDISSHFLGSIVYIGEGIQLVAAVPELLVIDGQQRLTTLSLLILTLIRSIKESGCEIGRTPKQLSNYYLFNSDEDGELRYKLLLTSHDKDTLIQLLDEKELSSSSKKASPNLDKNYRFFEEKLNGQNNDLIKAIYAGIQKLMIVNIALDRNYDDPQLIFESLNSTGLSLSQADLIRNYVLMGQNFDFQSKLYNDHWLPMEEHFEDAYTKNFDGFVRDYLTLKRRQIPNIGAVYETFKNHVPREMTPEALQTTVAEIALYAKHYVCIALGNEEDSELKDCFADINTLEVTVAFPFLLEVYDDYKAGKISKIETIDILRLVESYVFRRAICDIPTNSLNRTFAERLMPNVNKNNYLESLKKAFLNLEDMSDTYRYPSDSEFKQEFMVKGVYNNSKRCQYMLRKLENHNNKQPIHRIGDYTVEHVMPQNNDLSEEWQKELGENWQEIQEQYLHTIGNLTLTGYNPELSDRSFNEKKELKPGGFKDGGLRLNVSLVEAERWDEGAIKSRANELAEKALKIWTYPKLANFDTFEELDDFLKETYQNR